MPCGGLKMLLINGEVRVLTENIGGVTLDLQFYSGEDLYSDGVVEDELLKIVSENSADEYEKIIAQRRKWAILYHLSKQRTNCLEWIDGDKNAAVLEIGSGCGAITGCLAEKYGSVTCVELSKKRSLINANRNKDKNNIKIYVGNFQTVAPSLPQFDVITLIGVLEYGRLYIDSPEPYTAFLKQIKGLLRPNGRVIIAIENRLGLKYWAGCREDHTGRYYDSIENYPEDKGIQTFSKGELTEILEKAGFDRHDFYYPYPDYKLASTVYSDAYLPRRGELNNNLRNFDGERIISFDERRAFDSLIENGLFAEFSNSFLVIGGAENA